MIGAGDVDVLQEHHDKFYFRHGPCCAGCDWWRIINGAFGCCTASAPVSGSERAGMLGIESCSYPIPAGPVITKKDHVCGDFRDEFDWSLLPLSYRCRVGAPR